MKLEAENTMLLAHDFDAELKTVRADNVSLRAALAEAIKQNEITHSAYVEENNRVMAERETLRATLVDAHKRVSEYRDESLALRKMYGPCIELKTALATAREAMKQIGYASTEGCDYRTTTLWFQSIARIFLERT